MPPWIVFLVSAALVASSGIRLARDGETLGHASGLGGLWIGAILVAAATSLPELATDISAVLQGHPSLAIGDLFGSTMANMLILAFCSLLTRRARLLGQGDGTQAIVGTVATLVTMIAALGILTEHSGTGPFGWSAVAVIVGYAAGMRVMHANRDRQSPGNPAATATPVVQPVELRRAIWGFAIAAMVILVSAPLLASSAAAVGDALGLSRGLAGMVLLAFTTSLPEAVVSVAAIRSGAYSLAVGNLLGSCAFNMAAILPLDLVQRGGPILALVDRQLAVAAVVGAAMIAVATLHVLHKSSARRWSIEPGPLALIALYAVGLLLTSSAGP